MLCGSMRRNGASGCTWTCVNDTSSGSRDAIDEEPIHADLCSDVGKCVELDRLARVAIGTEAVALLQIGILGGRRQHDDRYGLQVLVSLHPTQDLDPINLGHPELEQNQTRLVPDRPSHIFPFAEEKIERSSTVLKPHQMVGKMVPLQGVNAEFRIGFVVLYQQYFNPVRHLPPPLAVTRNLQSCHCSACL